MQQNIQKTRFISVVQFLIIYKQNIIMTNLIKVDIFIKQTGLSERLVFNAIRANEFTVYKVGSVYFAKLQDLETWILTKHKHKPLGKQGFKTAKSIGI